MSEFTKHIIFGGKPAVLACDGCCQKAWGICARPRVEFDPEDPDDDAWLADQELGQAPADPGSYEGGQAKPDGPHHMNKWCSRECERSEIFDPAERVVIKDFSRRIYNKPGKHPEAT